MKFFPALNLLHMEAWATREVLQMAVNKGFNMWMLFNFHSILKNTRSHIYREANVVADCKKQRKKESCKSELNMYVSC